MWPIVRDALAGASPPIRSQIRWVAGLWCGLVLLQMWDSRNAAGVARVADFLSAILGATGVALLGTAQTLQRTMDEAESRPRPREAWRRCNRSCSRFPRWASRQVSRSARPRR